MKVRNHLTPSLKRKIRFIISIPFIGSVLFPVLLLDIFVEIYHRLCFPLYGLEYVERKKYIRIDRHHLSYLSWKEKIFCVYCGYVNGFFHYASVIAGETELYWCAIKHKNRRDGFIEPHHHDQFVAYGDQEMLEEKFPQS